MPSVLLAKNSATWCGIINVSIAYQSRRWQVSGSTREATISPLIWSTRKWIWSIAYASLVFYLGKILRRKFLFRSHLFVVLFFCRVWEKRVDVLGEKRLEIGTTRRNAWFSSPSQAPPFMQILVLSRDNVKCTHRLNLSSTGEIQAKLSQYIIRLFYRNFSNIFFYTFSYVDLCIHLCLKY